MSQQAMIIAQGTTWEMSWPITEDGSPKDVSGFSVRAQIRSPDRYQALLHEWSTALGNATASGTTVTLLLTPDVTSAWTWDHGVYDVEITSPAGGVFRVAEGIARLSLEVTRN